MIQRLLRPKVSQLDRKILIVKKFSLKLGRF